MKRMLYPLTQEQILNCPEFFAMTLNEILLSKRAPFWLMNMLINFPWTGRQNVIQVKPQDYRVRVPEMLGDHWHCDNNVRLRDGIKREATHPNDFRLMVVSFGDVVETEFKWGFARANELVMYSQSELHRCGQNPRLGNARLMIVAFECDNYLGGGRVFPSINEGQRPLGEYTI